MNKQAEAFAGLMKQAFPSPLEDAFKRWRETTKEINRMRKEKDEH